MHRHYYAITEAGEGLGVQRPERVGHGDGKKKRKKWIGFGCGLCCGFNIEISCFWPKALMGSYPFGWLLAF
jgi:hypothetical protein